MSPTTAAGVLRRRCAVIAGVVAVTAGISAGSASAAGQVSPVQKLGTVDVNLRPSCKVTTATSAPSMTW